jgi:hypothetical protein
MWLINLSGNSHDGLSTVGSHGLSRIQLMERKIRTKRGEHLNRKRAASIEPVFGQQRQRGMGVFRRRGLKACECEWRFEHGVHNLLKIRTSDKWPCAQDKGISRPTSRSQRIRRAFRCLGTR